MILKKLLNQFPIAIPHPSWEEDLHNRVYSILSSEGINFCDLKPSKLPTSGGIYIITDRRVLENEIIYYIGVSGNLQQRIYNNHLMGPVTNARLKNYLVNDQSPGAIHIINKELAKDFIKDNCKVRWILEDDFKMRAYIEGYLTGLLKPMYGIYKEH